MVPLYALLKLAVLAVVLTVSSSRANHKANVDERTVSVSRPKDVARRVVFMHGILGGPDEFDQWAKLIEKTIPNVGTLNVDMYDGLMSTVAMWVQVNKIVETLEPVLTNSSESTVLICFSQGGLLCRGILSVMKHNVETFIALSSPLAGQFGDTDYLKLLFPHYLRDNVYRIAYTGAGQDISVGGYWNDPRQQALYRQWSQYLAVLNNETDAGHSHSQQFKSNFLRIKNLVLIGGPDDGVITPWQSSQFQMYDSDLKVLPMEQMSWYKNDAFGLKTLKERGAITNYVIPGIEHIHWHTNMTVFNKCILPYIKS